MRPIYHRPIATIAMIVVNVLVILDLSLARSRGVDPGPGRRPPPAAVGDEHFHALRHLSSGRQHDVPLDVRARRRGKLGWWAFLLVYLGLGRHRERGHADRGAQRDARSHAGLIGRHFRSAGDVPGLGTHERGCLHHLAAVHADVSSTCRSSGSPRLHRPRRVCFGPDRASSWPVCSITRRAPSWRPP